MFERGIIVTVFHACVQAQSSTRKATRFARSWLACGVLPCSGLQELLAASGGAPLGLLELAELLEIGRTREAVEQFETLRSFVLERWRKPAGNRVRYVAPIYVSSFCIDTCAYCNFSASRKAAVRRRLTPGDLGAEIEGGAGARRPGGRTGVCDRSRIHDGSARALCRPAR